MVILIFMYLRVSQKSVSSGWWFVAFINQEYSLGLTVKKVSCSKCIEMIFIVIFTSAWQIKNKYFDRFCRMKTNQISNSYYMNLLMTFSGCDRSKRFVINTANNRFIGRIDYWTFEIRLIADKDSHFISNSFIRPGVPS